MFNALQGTDALVGGFAAGMDAIRSRFADRQMDADMQHIANLFVEIEHENGKLRVEVDRLQKMLQAEGARLIDANKGWSISYASLLSARNALRSAGLPIPD